MRSNRIPVAIGVASLVIGSVASQYLVGLNAGIAVVLFLLIVATALGIYRILNHSPLMWDQPLTRSRLLVSLLAGLIVVGLVIQAVPFGRDRSNPPVTAEPAWDSLRTRELAVRACFACHSNEVEYPWQSKIAPFSWAVQIHVEQGRDEVNYSEWDRPQDDANESAETVIEGEMPPLYYTFLTNSQARLIDTEKQDLIDGLIATFGTREDKEEDDD